MPLLSHAAHFGGNGVYRGGCPGLPLLSLGMGDPDADLAARGQIALVINGVTVTVTGDQGALAGAGVGVGVSLPIACGTFSGAVLCATGNGTLQRPRCFVCITSSDTLFHIEFEPGFTRTTVAWELGHTFVLSDYGGGASAVHLSSEYHSGQPKPLAWASHVNLQAAQKYYGVVFVAGSTAGEASLVGSRGRTFAAVGCGPCGRR